MISASSEGCSRAKRLSLTERRTCDGLTSRIGATESHAIIERGTLPMRESQRCPNERSPSRRRSPASPTSAATTRRRPPALATSMSLIRTTLRPSTSTICLSSRSATR